MSDEKVVKITKDGSTATYRETAVEKSKDGSTHIMTNDNENLKTKALRAENAVADLVDSALDKATKTIKTKASELSKSGALESGYAVGRKDSADIGRLGPMVTDLAATFENTITMIRNHPYDEQVRLLTGYKKLLEEQINVIDSRIHFIKRVR